MPNFEMNLSVPTNSKKLFELAIDFENFKKLIYLKDEGVAT